MTCQFPRNQPYVVYAFTLLVLCEMSTNERGKVGFEAESEYSNRIHSWTSKLRHFEQHRRRRRRQRRQRRRKGFSQDERPQHDILTTISGPSSPTYVDLEPFACHPSSRCPCHPSPSPFDHLLAGKLTAFGVGGQEDSGDRHRGQRSG